MKRIFLLMLNLAFISCCFAQSPAIITGKIDHLKKDTIKLVLRIDPITLVYQTHLIPVSDGNFTKQLNITSPVFMYMTDGTNSVQGLIEPGDQTVVHYDAGNFAGSLQLEGTGHEKFQFLTDLVSFGLYKKTVARATVWREKQHPFDEAFAFADSFRTAFTGRLNKIKENISKESYQLLKAEIEAATISNRFSSVGLIYHETVEKTLQTRGPQLTDRSRNAMNHLMDFDKDLFYSSTYVNNVYNILFKHYDSRILNGQSGKGLHEKYEYLDSMLAGKLKIPVLTMFLESDITKLNQAEDLEAIIAKTYTAENDSTFRNFVLRRYADVTSFKKGMPAPDFVLENEKGEKVSLVSFKGKVVYLDFWYATCVPCHALFETIKPVKDHFANNDKVVFLSVSIDSKDKWKEALKKFNIPGYHVFTENREADHAVIKAYKVAGYPTTCLIDQEGKIVMATPSNRPDELQSQIEAVINGQ